METTKILKLDEWNSTVLLQPSLRSSQYYLDKEMSSCWQTYATGMEAIGGGFTARVIFIVEEKKGKTVPKHDITAEEQTLREMLRRDLERINQLCGGFSFTPAGEDAYTSWYTEEDTKLSKGEAAIEDTRFAAYCERRATHLRKLMMLLSAGRGDSLQLDLPDFTRAKTILSQAEIKMGRTFGGLGKARYSDATEQVLEFIKAVGVTTRSSILSHFYRTADVPNWNNRRLPVYLSSEVTELR